MGTNNKLREALEKIANYDYAFVDGSYCHDGQICADIARKALAAPRLNCEVGTVEEQAQRHHKWCRKYGIDGEGKIHCAHPDMSCTLCTLRWSQMPYEESEAKKCN